MSTPVQVTVRPPERVAAPAGGSLGRRLKLALAVGALLLTSACAAPGGGSGTMEITAYFKDSAGLFVGNDVGILGVPVGEITEIEPVGRRVRITMEVDGDHEVPADVGAVVVARSVATDRYVELTPVYRNGATLQDGAEIGLDRTRTPVDFDEVLESLNEFATGIAGDRGTTRAIQRFIDEGADALRGRGALVNQAVHALADGTNALSGQRDDVAATLRSLDVLLAAIAADEQTARTFIRQVARASELLATEREEFRTALRSLDRAVTTVAEFAVDHRAEIVDALGGSTRLMRVVLRKQEALTEILRVMPLALQNLRLAARGGRLPVVMKPSALLPLGGILQDLCDRLAPDLCDLLGTDPLRGRGRGSR